MPLLSTRGAASARGFGLLGRVKAITDPFFNYVTMLLHGDGTNGAQNNTFLDSSTNNFTITRNGNTTQGSFSPYGTLWSNYFDGSGDYLRLSSAINLSGDFTAEAFVYSDSTFTGQNQIFGSDLSTADGNKQLYIASSTNKLTIYDGSSASASSGSVPQNQWSHVAITRQGSTLTFYINGVSSGTATVTATMSFRIVGGLVTGSGINEQFKGYISNARIVSGTAVYTSNFTPSTTPLTAISGTSLLTCQSNRFIDNSSNNFTVSVFGNPSVQRFSPFAPTAAYSTATIGGSGYFDGTGDYLSCGSQTAYAVGSGNFTAELWFYPTNITATSYSTLINTRSGAVNDSSAWVVSYTSSGSAIFYSDGFLITSATGLITNNQWFHIALVRNGNTATLYLNGISIGTANISAYDFTRNELSVGANNNGSEPIQQAYIANVRLVKGTAVYNSNFTPPTAPLTAITNTSLLLNMTNGAIFDNAMMNDLETVGNAQISTSVVKFGTGSMAFDGTGDYLVSAPSPSNILGSGDFTLEFFAYPSNTSSGYRALVGSENYNAVAGGWTIYQNGTSIEVWLTGSQLINATSVLSASTWQHIALCRSGTTVRLFVNGSSVASPTNSATWTGQIIFIGDNNISGTDYFFNGYIDELRITKGVARYTANFTPPTAAFPNQ